MSAFARDSADLVSLHQERDLRGLVDTEVIGDELDVQQPKDQQHERDRADECERDQDEACESVGREVSLAPLRPRGLCVPREWFGGHPSG
jgi:hypothetical protein